MSGFMSISKVEILWESHKKLRNQHFRFDVYYIQSNLRWRFLKFLWPSPNIWTLPNQKPCLKITIWVFFFTYSPERTSGACQVNLWAWLIELQFSRNRKYLLGCLLIFFNGKSLNSSLLLLDNLYKNKIKMTEMPAQNFLKRHSFRF